MRAFFSIIIVLLFSKQINKGLDEVIARLEKRT